MGISERKMREKKERRDAILGAAERLFFARPYDAVSMDEIALAAELSKPTLYLYFGDKESLYLTIVERGYRVLADLMHAAVKDADSGIDRLAAIGMSYHTFVKTCPDYSQVLNTFRSGRFDAPDPARNGALFAVNRVIQEIFDLNDAAIRAGIQDGTLRSDIDPVVLSVFLSNFSTSINNLSPGEKKQLEERGVSGEQFACEFINMMYNMMENPAKPVPRRTRAGKGRSPSRPRSP